MTQRFALFAAALGGLALATPVDAQTPSNSGVAFTGTVGIEGHYQNYRESSIGVQEDGFFGGVTGAGQAEWERWQLRGDVRVAYGRMDYTGSGRIDGIDDYVFEGRAVIGYVIPVGGSAITRFLPYAGYGYRTLLDDLGGRTSTTGARGYDRISQYHYVPIGLETTIAGGSGWTFKPTVEYDYFITGRQESKLSQASTGLPDLTHTQDSGFGLRGSLMAATTWADRPIEFGPFVRYWNIDDSEVKSGFFEPENETVEAGLALKLGF
jgi:hypothetical protein